MEEEFPGQESEAFPLVLALPFTCWVTSDSSFYLAHPQRGVTNMQRAVDNGSRAPWCWLPAGGTTKRRERDSPPKDHIPSVNHPPPPLASQGHWDGCS